MTYIWQKPNKVLLESGKVKQGYDGGSGWMLSSKKKVSKLPKGSQIPLEIDANPLRYVHFRQIYSEVKAAPPASYGERRMDVLVAPNNIGLSKFFFDAQTHLLARVEELGEVSAYYKQIFEFMDYRDVDGVKLPFRIIHSSEQPGDGDEELRYTKVEQNIPLKAELFSRPKGAVVVLGGKR